MKDIVTVLKGIVLLLCSLFVLGISDTPVGELAALALFVAGLLVCLVGFHNFKLND